VRDKAKSRARENRTGQTELLLGMPGIDVRYRNMRDRDLATALQMLRSRIAAEGPLRFDQIWPSLLEENHVTLKYLADAVLEESTGGRLVVQGFLPRERTIKDAHIIALPRPEGT
jgi:hypothetical protein